MNPSPTPLKHALLKEYGAFSDKRIKNIEKGSKFFVDDRSDGGLASDGNPFGWFCTVLADVVDAHTVRVSLGVGGGERDRAFRQNAGIRGDSGQCRASEHARGCFLGYRRAGCTLVRREALQARVPASGGEPRAACRGACRCVVGWRRGGRVSVPR